MKKIICVALAAALASAPGAFAEESAEGKWNSSIEFAVGFSQTGFFNWSAGGYNSLSLATGIDAKASYAKKLMNWNNRLQLNYGFLWTADKSNLLQKSTDRIYLESKFSYKTAKESKWSYSASFDFRTQFSDSKDKYVQNEEGKWDGTLKSSFLSPGYTNIALGMDWVPTKWFDMNIAPLTGGFTLCTVESLKSSYGMKLRDTDDPSLGYRSSLFQFGAQIKANARIVVNDNLKYETQVVLFTDYLNKPFAWNRVNWDNKISFQAGRFFKVALNTWFIYDPIVEIDGVRSKAQFKEFFSVNFTYTIAPKKK